ncbi:MAG TPA: hypothetical protein VHD87_14615 [Acidimicrobiales bacterium]|nr:hypothetical protein [Acidimicrobiales bacterium]
MSTARRRTWATALVATTGLLAGCGGSAPPPVAGTRPHHLHASVHVEGLARPVTASVTLAFPARWDVTAATATHLRFREGTRGCTYTVDARPDVVSVDAATATDAARSLVPTGTAHLLESGQRGSAAWRVVKLRGNGTQVRLDAVRTQPLRSVTARAGRPTWLATRLTAASDVGDECHSGTYRDTLGPALGDALATLRARAY